jgi:60 kDa SS-A/Ro ribonucleoprotein
MANKQLFSSANPGKTAPPTDAVNEAGGRAYTRSDKGILAQFAVTGCLNSTYYTKDEDQLKLTLELAEKVDSEFLAKVAIYAREQGYMKDMPALLTAVLFGRTKDIRAEDERNPTRLAFKAAFGRCIDNGKMLKNFVQIVRSGVVGRKSIGATALKKLIQKWFDGHTDDQLVWNSVGNDPSLGDVIRLARVNPRTPARRALFKWITGLDVGEKDRKFGYDADALPQLVKDYEAWKRSTKAARPGKPPRVPFQMLTSLDLSQGDWEQIAKDASWTQTRMNLNTFLRHGVFTKPKNVTMVADRIKSRALIEKAKVFPYQLMTAYNYTSTVVGMPQKVTLALQQALDLSLENIPNIEGHVVMAPDLSGSMGAAVTGNRNNSQTSTGALARRGRPSGATSVVACREVAALVTAAFLRKMPETTVLPFSDHVDIVRLNPLDSVATNAKLLSRLPSGGTDCSLPLAYMNQQKIKADLVIYLSDDESWMDFQGRTQHRYGWGARDVRQATGLMEQWNIFKSRNPKARLVCVDLCPNPTGQVIVQEDILSIGGWSDTCFKLIADFARNGNGGKEWADRIDAMPLYESVSPRAMP